MKLPVEVIYYTGTTISSTTHALRPGTYVTHCGLKVARQGRETMDYRQVRCIKCRRAVDPEFKAQARKPHKPGSTW